MSRFERKFLSSFLRSLSRGARLASGFALPGASRHRHLSRGGSARRLLRGASCQPWFIAVSSLMFAP